MNLDLSTETLKRQLNNTFRSLQSLTIIITVLIMLYVPVTSVVPLQLPLCLISTSNSMGSSEIWDKYHQCCIGNGDKFHEAKPSEIYHFQYNKSGIYPKFHCYPCYSQLIPYSLHIRMPCISVAMYAICHYVLNMCQH